MSGAEGFVTTFSFIHVVCGATVQVVDGVQQPHRCRIDLDAQRNVRDEPIAVPGPDRGFVDRM